MALTRKRQSPRKYLRQKPLNRGVTSQAGMVQNARLLGNTSGRPPGNISGQSPYMTKSYGGVPPHGKCNPAMNQAPRGLVLDPEVRRLFEPNAEDHSLKQRHRGASRDRGRFFGFREAVADSLDLVTERVGAETDGKDVRCDREPTRRQTDHSWVSEIRVSRLCRLAAPWCSRQPVLSRTFPPCVSRPRVAPAWLVLSE